MDNGSKNHAEEQQYLKNTILHIRKELGRELEMLEGRKAELIRLRKDMWENTSHSTDDFEKLTEVSQFLSFLDSQTASYSSTRKQIDKYRRLLKSPYFGRFDFREEADGESDKIYLGIHNVIDMENHSIMVYDWRAPISSIYYEFELGAASYSAPHGSISGEVVLKRQYKIDKGRLEYFFDSSIRIDDEMLQQALYRNSSLKMRNIVETIQKEQNSIIRDTDTELLIVQGAAGSGKTSIALHRIAFLLYQGLGTKLNSNNILVISPNEIFSSYIGGVIPELGEENVERITFNELCCRFLGDRGKIEKRNESLEQIISSNEQEAEDRKSRMEFKGSQAFAALLDRAVNYYEKNRIQFEDVYYDGKIIESKQSLRNLFLNGKIAGPSAKKLKRLEQIIFDRIHPFQRERTERIVKLVKTLDGHEFDYKAVGRYISIKESGMLQKKVRNFTELDYMDIYILVFNDKKLFLKLAEGLELPHDIERIWEITSSNIKKGFFEYEDCAPLMYLKLTLEGSEKFSEIRQVVIDEAQDYSPIQYKVFKLLFENCRFTVLGDIGQSIDKEGSFNLYNEIEAIFAKSKSLRLVLNKSYRSTLEISEFARKIQKQPQDIACFERHGAPPELSGYENEKEMNLSVIKGIEAFFAEGYETVAVICKTSAVSHRLYSELKDALDIRLIVDENGQLEQGAVVLPAYMAKGLEFDAVIVYDASNGSYCTELDRRLLYIACSRALHRLLLCYSGTKSRFI